MAFSIDRWMEEYRRAAEERFGERIWFMGLQGSYGRGEATEESDIDVVLILDRLDTSDLQEYSRMLDALPERNRICGFVSGREELLAWEPSDLFQFCHDTVPVSYTHLDVYKRQVSAIAFFLPGRQTDFFLLCT